MSDKQFPTFALIYTYSMYISVYILEKKMIEIFIIL